MARFLLIVMLAAAAPAWVQGAVLRTTAFVPDSDESWYEIVQVERFDPLLGDLHEVRILIEGEFHGLVRHENLNVLGCSYSDEITWDLEVRWTPDGALEPMIAFDEQAGFHGTLTAFDGEVDYSGDSGDSRAVTVPVTGGLTYAGEAAAKFVGTTNLMLEIGFEGAVQVSLTDPSAATITNAGCEVVVTVEYEFSPAAVSSQLSSWSEIKTSFR